MSTAALFSCPKTFYPEFERKGSECWTTHYCPGCGHGLIHKYVAEAIDDFAVQDRTIFVSPVGCAVFAYYYFDVGNVQVAHGRCPAAATALKRAWPDSLVLGYQGDGDLAAIGGNEILHAANRGENVTIFFVNNAIYGMTGGQLAPTSIMGMETTTTPRGRSASNEGYPVRVCELLATLEAPYYLERVAVGDPRHNHRARKAIRKAIRNQLQNHGFSLVEILSPCPTGWKRDPVDAARWTIEELTETFPLGVFRDGNVVPLGHPRRRRTVDQQQLHDLLGVSADDPSDPVLPDARRGIDETRVKIAGFGGQGVLFLGTLLARAGMLAGRRVSWLPSYGPEMRGGTAHCHVTLSDGEIGSPLVSHPHVLIAMNEPSLERFLPDVVPGGTVLYDASSVERPPERFDVTLVPVPLAEITGTKGRSVANMVMFGALIGHTGLVSLDAVLAALSAMVDTGALASDREAIEAGIDAVRETPA